MILTRQEMASLLQVSDKYLCPSNFQHIQNGAKTKGYNLINMQGKGKGALYEIEPLQADKFLDEEWKSFPLAPSYLVSNYGRIKHPNGGILQGTINKGYVRTRISNLGQLSNHRIVMLTFSPIEHPENYSVDHINGVKNDNRLENLRWVYQSENMEFADNNNTQIKFVIAELIQKIGYDNTLEKLQILLEESNSYE